MPSTSLNSVLSLAKSTRGSRKVVYVALILTLAVDVGCILSVCSNNQDKLPKATTQQHRRTVNYIPTISKAQLRLSKPNGYEQQQQQQQQELKSDEYEKLSKAEQKTIDENRESTEQTAGTNQVIPSQDENENSQVVFVNLSRVVNDSSNKNETIRLIGNNEQLIKQGEKIPCGETNRNGEPSMVTPVPDTIANRIVGGIKAEPGEFPYQVRFNIKSWRGSSLCGGVIIDKRHILTAAHCVTTCSSYFASTSSIEPSSIKATIGDLRITVADGEQVLGIEKVTPHKQYSACSYSHNNYDIAILKTTKPMAWIFTKDGFGSVNRACLPQPDTDYQPGENATVTGWGVMNEGDSSISNVLSAVEVPIVSLEECKEVYGQRVNKDHVCAGLKQGGKDSCQGDSGGPLVRKIGGQSELVAVVSFGYGCAQPGVPGVYTKVSRYIDWIEKNL